MMSSFPSSLLPTLSPVVSFLRTLPLPATHPSHPAALSIFGTLKEAQKGYADMRGNWSVKCLEGQGKRLVARAESVDPLATGREFREWVELMLGTVEVSFACVYSIYITYTVTGRVQTTQRALPSFKPCYGLRGLWHAAHSYPTTIQPDFDPTHHSHQKVSP